MQAGGISIHAVDVAQGRVAEGLPVTLRRLAPDPAVIAEGRIGANGLLDHPSAQGVGIVAGLYEAELRIAAWLEGLGEPAPFLDVASLRFRVVDVAAHHHLPVKLTPFGCSAFRGA